MHGGRREGAGRKLGSPNKATIARQAEIAASGLTPLDYMLQVMRDEEADTAARLDAAKAAAPYVHPRLTSIEHSGSIGTYDDSDEEKLEQRIRELNEAIAALGPAPRANGGDRETPPSEAKE